jgi:hypothetical protein
MRELFYRVISGIAVFSLLILLVSCGDGGSGSPDTATGTLKLGLTDAATGNYQAIYVTIAEVQVKKQDDGGSGWQTVVTPDQTYNLLELVNGVIKPLGIGELGTGQYGQMRLILGDQPDGSENILNESHPYANYLIDSEDNSIELKVPSGYQTGIKVVKGFWINASQATELILDFDGARSVVQAGKSGKWLLKPTIKVLETVDNSVSGMVEDDGGAPIEGGLVSAQFYDPDAVDLKNEVLVETTTVSTEEGAYKLFLPPDIYNIVVAKDGYLPACQEIEAQFFKDYIANFSLVAVTETILVSGAVSGLASEEDSAHLSIRQTISCGSADVIVEVASASVANDTTSEAISLPAGMYDVVVSADEEETQVFEDINTNTVLDIIFGQ